MVIDQFGLGPRRVYAIVRLVSHGNSWGVDGVIGVPYVPVRISYMVAFAAEIYRALSLSRHLW
jgi:hypothetical protein